MKQLTDSERLKIALALLGNSKQYYTYHRQCVELEHDCRRNGFYDVPATCEGSECGNCMLVDYDRRAVDCPYLE